MKSNIGEFLAILRKSKGMTQQEAANWLGVSNKTVSSWETGASCPDISMLPALAELYGVTIVGQDGYDLQFSSGKPPSKQNAALYIGISVAVLAAAGIAVAAVLIHRKKERKK